MPPTQALTDPDLLRSFVAVCETGSFTAAGKQLGRGQPTVSQHIKRLEHMVGKRLLERDTHAVSTTPSGDAVFDHARTILDAHDRLERFIRGSELRGRLRFGACDDFVMSALPAILAQFAHRHPAVDVELTVALSEPLYEKFDAGGLDIIFVKRRSGDERGRTAWSEPLAWVGKEGFREARDAPIPLLLYPPPSMTRALAIETLEACGRSWRIAFTSGSLSGLSAAARAGLGVMPHSGRLLPPGCAVIAASDSLPKLPRIEFVVIGPGGHNKMTESLTALILAGIDPAWQIG